MPEEWDEYIKDPRIVCKYGAKCYQKNPEHHNKYKHPPELKAKTDKKQRNKRFHPYNKVKNARLPSKDSERQEKVPKKTKDTELNDDIQPSASKEIDTENTEVFGNSDKEKEDADNALEELKHVVNSDSLSFFDKDSDHSILKECFLVEMPPDFFKFYECLNEESENVEKLLSSVNLQLIGPFDLFLGKLPELENKDLYLIHWRFFFDPPEFQAVLKKKGKSEFHIGYYRDDPKEQPVFLAKADSSAGYSITPIAENIFGAIYWFLQEEKKTSPFISIACQKLMEKVKKWAESSNYSIEEFNMKKRNLQFVCRTFHGAGIVVPYNKKTQLGYRKLADTDANIKKMFKQLKEANTQSERDKVLSELQPVITYASIAVDECDFGTGLEAGIALFCSGIKELQTSALKNLDVAYSLLQREAFRKIIQVHMKYRRRGPDMSVISI